MTEQRYASDTDKDPIVCSITLRHQGKVQPPTQEQKELEHLLGKRTLKDAMEVYEVIDAMYRVRGGKKIDHLTLFMGLYGAGVIAGIRQEREKNHKNKMSAYPTDQD